MLNPFEAGDIKNNCESGARIEKVKGMIAFALRDLRRDKEDSRYEEPRWKRRVGASRT